MKQRDVCVLENGEFFTLKEQPLFSNKTSIVLFLKAHLSVLNSVRQRDALQTDLLMQLLCSYTDTYYRVFLLVPY